MTRLLAVLVTLCFAVTVAAQEPPANDPPPADPTGVGVAGNVEEQAGAQAPPEAEVAEDPNEDPNEDPMDDPGAEELAQAAAAAGGEIGEVDEEFTPRDEISEDYPVPLPADI